MRIASLLTLVRRDLRRTRGALVTTGFGIAAGTAALVFFLALGLGVRAVLLGDVFPVDQIELEPPKTADPGLLALLVGNAAPRGIASADVDRIAHASGVKAVFPKLKFAFPASARGGKEIFGYDVGTSEMIADGIDPALVEADTKTLAHPFADPIAHGGPACHSDLECSGEQYCEIADSAPAGTCSDPVPALVSRYLVEIFDKSIAPAHGLPPVGETLVGRAQAVTFTLRIGESLLGRARSGAPRNVRARVVGVSKRAIDIGLTFPLDVVRRWNKEYAGDRAAELYSSVMVQTDSSAATSDVLGFAAGLALEPKDTRARDVSILITSVTALLSLVAAIILLVSASNIAYTFRVLVNDRRSEIALYRAIGAAGGDVRAWMMALALTVGVLGGAIGVAVARLLAVATDVLAARRLPDFPFKPATFFAFPLWLYAMGIGFAALFAALGAFSPARRAARVDPASALAQN